MIKWFMDRMEKAAQKHWVLIPNSKTKNFFVAIHTYKGKPIKLKDDTIIKNGDTVGELHVNNHAANVLDGNLREIFMLMDAEFALLAKASRENKTFQNIKAYYGRGVLYPLAAKKGFEVREIETLRLKLFLRVWDNLIKHVYSSSKRGRNKFRKPKESWISADYFIQKNGSSEYE